MAILTASSQKKVTAAFKSALSQQTPTWGFAPLDPNLEQALGELMRSMRRADIRTTVYRTGENEFSLKVGHYLRSGSALTAQSGIVNIWLGKGPGVREIPVYLGPAKDPKTNDKWAYPHIDCFKLGDLGATDKTDLAVELVKKLAQALRKEEPLSSISFSR